MTAVSWTQLHGLRDIRYEKAAEGIEKITRAAPSIRNDSVQDSVEMSRLSRTRGRLRMRRLLDRRGPRGDYAPRTH
jgi:1,4-dihydroxy-2-naphthoyl-CoA synthase